MRIVVVSLRGGPPGQALAAEFGPTGGTIGRSDSNTLVLDDPERTVSRVHAQVLCRGTEFFIVDRGSNPLTCNGQPLGAGNEARLSNGDRLVMGGFELQVQGIGASSSAAPAGSGAVASAAAEDDPFAGLLDGLTPAAQPPAKVASASSGGSPKLSAAAQNPMEFNVRSGAMADPFADLLDPRAAKPQAASAGQHDDFSDLGLPNGGLPANIDAMFGLGLGAAGSDPFAQSPLAAPLMQPNTASAADPLAALQRQAKPSAAAQSDHVPALQHAFVTGPTKPPPLPAALPMDDFSDLLGPPSAPAPAPAPAPQLAPAAVLQRVEIGLMADPAPRPSPAAALPAVAAVSLSPGQYSDADLLAAFLKGVNSAHQMPVALTPGLMERIGSILRSATEGTLQLLMTRQELKREVRAEVTMIGSQHNNPLKFSPTVEVALAHLLGPGVRGFMPAQEAMQDAFNDLRAHQIGVMVGLQAALGHVLTRFTPDQLEKRLTEKSTFDTLFSAGRKAKLWDQFCTLHASISQEAEDDFHKLFGEAFSKAYEEQMANLKSSPDKR